MLISTLTGHDSLLSTGPSQLLYCLTHTNRKSCSSSALFLSWLKKQHHQNRFGVLLNRAEFLQHGLCNVLGRRCPILEVFAEILGFILADNTQLCTGAQNTADHHYLSTCIERVQFFPEPRLMVAASAAPHEQTDLQRRHRQAAACSPLVSAHLIMTR